MWLLEVQPQPVHVLYESADSENLPRNTWLTLAELGVVTGPGSKVPVVYRWDKDTIGGAIIAGETPNDNVLWKAGDPPLAPSLADLSKDPKDPGIYDPLTGTWFPVISLPDVPLVGVSPGTVAPEVVTGPVSNPRIPGSFTPEIITEPTNNPGNPVNQADSSTHSPLEPERVLGDGDTSSTSGSESGGCLPCVGRPSCVFM
ncbi:hypothetical protein BKA65DRAFT_558483 [Rhexocercosporidium sp. MPI-PUGE-AT-0058]|nr:hypothetical protein BKA65DRAFT_558483 [Rhexocercosporidium sp. MPI-PUGE-AT-0058]